MATFYLFVEGFEVLDLLIFPLFRDWSASLLDSRLRWPRFLSCLSDGEAGGTPVDFLAGSFSETMDFYECCNNACLGDGEAG